MTCTDLPSCRNWIETGAIAVPFGPSKLNVEALTVFGSRGLEKSKVKARKDWPTVSALVIFWSSNFGGMVSRTSCTVIGAEVVMLPPVSVARICNVT